MAVDSFSYLNSYNLFEQNHFKFGCHIKTKIKNNHLALPHFLVGSSGFRYIFRTSSSEDLLAAGFSEDSLFRRNKNE